MEPSDHRHGLRRFLASTWGPPRSEARALSCLFTNLLVLPGLGSLMGGRRVGWVQLTLALAGFGLTLAFLVDWAGRWIHSGRYPFDPGPWLVWGLAGLAAFGFAWAWSLATSYALMRSVRPSQD